MTRLDSQVVESLVFVSLTILYQPVCNPESPLPDLKNFGTGTLFSHTRRSKNILFVFEICMLKMNVFITEIQIIGSSN